MHNYVKKDRTHFKGQESKLFTATRFWQLSSSVEARAAEIFSPDHFSTLKLVMLSPSLNGHKKHLTTKTIAAAC